MLITGTSKAAIITIVNVGILCARGVAMTRFVMSKCATDHFLASPRISWNITGASGNFLFKATEIGNPQMTSGCLQSTESL